MANRQCECKSLCLCEFMSNLVLWRLIWCDLMDVSGETDLKVVNWKLRQCWDDVIDFHTLSEQYMEVRAIARNGWRGDEGTTAGSKEDRENVMGGRMRSRGGKSRREGILRLGYAVKWGLKDEHYGNIIGKKSYYLLELNVCYEHKPIQLALIKPMKAKGTTLLTCAFSSHHQSNWSKPVPRLFISQHKPTNPTTK